MLGYSVAPQGAPFNASVGSNSSVNSGYGGSSNLSGSVSFNGSTNFSSGGVVFSLDPAEEGYDSAEDRQLPQHSRGVFSKVLGFLHDKVVGGLAGLFAHDDLAQKDLDKAFSSAGEGESENPAGVFFADLRVDASPLFGEAQQDTALHEGAGEALEGAALSADNDELLEDTGVAERDRRSADHSGGDSGQSSELPSFAQSGARGKDASASPGDDRAGFFARVLRNLWITNDQGGYRFGSDHWDHAWLSRVYHGRILNDTEYAASIFIQPKAGAASNQEDGSVEDGWHIFGHASRSRGLAVPRVFVFKLPCPPDQGCYREGAAGFVPKVALSYGDNEFLTVMLKTRFVDAQGNSQVKTYLMQFEAETVLNGGVLIEDRNSLFLGVERVSPAPISVVDVSCRDDLMGVVDLGKMDDYMDMGDVVECDDSMPSALAIITDPRGSNRRFYVCHSARLQVSKASLTPEPVDGEESYCSFPVMQEFVRNQEGNLGPLMVSADGVDIAPYRMFGAKKEHCITGNALTPNGTFYGESKIMSAEDHWYSVAFKPNKRDVFHRIITFADTSRTGVERARVSSDAVLSGWFSADERPYWRSLVNLRSYRFSSADPDFTHWVGVHPYFIFDRVAADVWYVYEKPGNRPKVFVVPNHFQSGGEGVCEPSLLLPLNDDGSEQAMANCLLLHNGFAACLPGKGGDEEILVFGSVVKAGRGSAVDAVCAGKSSGDAGWFLATKKIANSTVHQYVSCSIWPTHKVLQSIYRKVNLGLGRSVAFAPKPPESSAAPDNGLERMPPFARLLTLASLARDDSHNVAPSKGYGNCDCISGCPPAVDKADDSGVEAGSVTQGSTIPKEGNGTVPAKVANSSDDNSSGNRANSTGEQPLPVHPVGTFSHVVIGIVSMIAFGMVCFLGWEYASQTYAQRASLLSRARQLVIRVRRTVDAAFASRRAADGFAVLHEGERVEIVSFPPLDWASIPAEGAEAQHTLTNPLLSAEGGASPDTDRQVSVELSGVVVTGEGSAQGINRCSGGGMMAESVV